MDLKLLSTILPLPSVLPKKLFIDIGHQFCAEQYRYINFKRQDKNLFIDKLLF